MGSRLGTFSSTDSIELTDVLSKRRSGGYYARIGASARET